MHLRQHKSFSEIEQDIKRFYDDGTVDVTETALKIAARALAVAQASCPPAERLEIEHAKQIIFDRLLDRQK
jgi:hypothetical protein